MGIKRIKEGLPICDVKVCSTETSSLPPTYKQILQKMGKEKNKTLCYASKSILDIAFIPDIIDRYPQDDVLSLPFPNCITTV